MQTVVFKTTNVYKAHSISKERKKKLKCLAMYSS